MKICRKLICLVLTVTLCLGCIVPSAASDARTQLTVPDAAVTEDPSDDEDLSDEEESVSSEDMTEESAVVEGSEDDEYEEDRETDDLTYAENPVNAADMVSDMEDMPETELEEGEGDLSVAEGSAIYVMMAEGAACPAAGSELAWILEQYDGDEWVPAAGVGYHTFDDEGLTCEEDLYTGDDGVIRLASTENGCPYIRFLEITVYLNPEEDQEGDYRITADEENTQEAWGELVGYAAEEADRPYDLEEHEGIAFVYSGSESAEEHETGAEDDESEIVLLSIEAKEEDDVLYLSDIDPVYSYIGWGYLRKDLSPSDTVITLRVNGAVTSFEKGLGAHAESTLIYDVKSVYSMGFDSFMTYYGVNSTATSGNVKFYMYTTTDEDYSTAEWTPVEGVDSSAKSGSSAAGFIEIPLTADMTYLKLYVDPNGGNGSDHSVYGDAKFVKTDLYFDSIISPLSVYDSKLKEYYDKYGDDLSKDTEYERLVLERELVYRVDYYEFQNLLTGEDGKGIREMVSWMLNADNMDFLKMYLTGGSVGGNYRTGAYSYSGSSNDPMTASLRVMYELWKVYRPEFSSTANNSLYPKMIISLSLTLTGNVKYWYGYTGSSSSDPVDNSIIYPDPVERYEIYKQLYADKMLVSYFDELQVPEMRYVMASPIHNDEIVWASNLAKRNNYNTNCYFWMSYISGYNYHRDRYYNDETWGDDPSYNYDEKYYLSAYNVGNYGYGTGTYVKYPMLWMCMADGGTCWPIANFCQNLWSSYGRPCYICGSMGGTHEVYMAYNRVTDSSGNSYGRWTIENGCGGDWYSTHYGAYDSTGWHIARMIGDWGMGSEFEFNNSSYIILGQSAINDFENYVYAEELEMLSRVFEDDEQVLESIYWDMLKVQSFHFDAWYGLVKLYSTSAKSDADRYYLASEMMAKDALFYYPLPMHDLLKILLKSVSSSIYSNMITSNEQATLKSAYLTTDADFYSAYAVRVVSNWLLGNVEADIGTFSFDGENAGKIILNDQFSDPEYWEYSLDGGETWSAIIHDTEVDDAMVYDADAYGISTLSQTSVENPNVVQLTAEEIAQVNPDDNILIRFIQVPDYWHVINIEQAATPVVGSIYDVTGLYANPWENCIVYATDTMEWRNQGDTEWIKFTDASPDRDENTVIEVRDGAHSVYTASEIVTLSYYNEDNHYLEFEEGSEDELSYIPLSRISIYDYTVQANSTRAVKYSMDGSIYSFYQTPANTAFPHYLTLKLNRPTYLSGLSYQCNLGNTAGGQIRQAKIYVSMTGNDDDWTEVEYLSGTDGLDSYNEDTGLQWVTGNDRTGKTPKNVYFTPVQAQYVKIVSYADGGTSSMTSIAAVRLYEKTDMADREELEELLADYTDDISSGALTEENYMSATWSVLARALREADNVLNDPDASQDEVDAAYHALLEAYDGLITCRSEEISISWDDDSDRDGIRPAYVTADILENGVVTDRVEVYSDGTGSWSYIVRDLPADEDIAITAAIEDVEGYTVRVNSDNDFTLSHSPEKVYITVKIVWDDDDDAEGKRPETIRCHLLADGVKEDSANLTYSNCQWNYTGFAYRYRYNKGSEINYTVVLDSETNPATGYITSYSSDGTNFEIINTYAPDKVNVSVTVAWDDAGNQDGLRPETVMISLLADGAKTGNTLNLTADDSWRGTFEQLDRQENSGSQIAWSVEGEDIAGYTMSVVYSASYGYIITYSYSPQTLSLSGSKSWDDNQDENRQRPDSAAIQLYANGTRIAEFIVNENNNWTWEADELALCEGGTEIIYTVTESPADNYVSVINGLDITNVYQKNGITIPVSVSWDDLYDSDGYRPEEITVTLTRYGIVTDTVLTLSAAEGWTGAFTGLEEYEENGIRITYGVLLSLPESVQSDYSATVVQNPDGTFSVSMLSTAVAEGRETAEAQEGAGEDTEMSGGSDTVSDSESAEDGFSGGAAGAETSDGAEGSADGSSDSTTDEGNTGGAEADAGASSAGTTGAETSDGTEGNADESTGSSSGAESSGGNEGCVEIHWSEESAHSDSVTVTAAVSDTQGSPDVTVTLYDGSGAAAGRMVLNSDNSWSYTFEGLSDDETYTLVSEADGYDCEFTGSAEEGYEVSLVGSGVKAVAGESEISGDDAEYMTTEGAEVQNQNHAWIYIAACVAAAAVLVILLILMRHGRKGKKDEED